MSTQSDFPQSVEEAGALLGAAITKCGKESYKTVSAPKGMHSSFNTVHPVPSSELLTRLHELRALLRSAPPEKPLVAAPSLLAVLMKLLGVSTSLAPAFLGTSTERLETPPMLSTPLRQLWVDCIVLCHKLGEGLSGTAKINTTQFIRQMLALAGTNPRSARAAGGVRIAALDVIAGLFENMSSQLAPWSLEVLHLCLRALRSAGNGEPTYRVSAIRTACATAIACRQASLKMRPLTGKAVLVLQGAMEDKAIAEAVKILRQAIADKFPEVRSTAANYAALLAPMLLQTGSETSPALALDEVMHLALKNLDDDSPYTADKWAEALARCMSTAIQYNGKLKATSSGNRNAEAEEARSSSTGDSDGLHRFGHRKHAGLTQTCSSLKGALSYLVDHFVKVGGEYAASKAGGTYSTGGRAVRVGISLAITKLLCLQSELGSLREDQGLSAIECIRLVLSMLGEQLEKQLRPPANVESGGPAGPLFGAARTWSKADAGLARQAVSRIIRRGLSSVAAESAQMAILHDLVLMLPAPEGGTTDTQTFPAALNGNQLQVLLIEISHLLSALGEAAASKTEDIIARLSMCLDNQDHGVRHEAAIAFAALTASFPSEGRKIVRSSIDEIQVHHAQLVTLASMGEDKTKEQHGPGLRMFRRPQKEKHVDPSLQHQYAIHGRALMVSILVRDLPPLPGGLPKELLGNVLSVAEILVSCHHNDILTKANPGAVCCCVRGGFSIISGVLTTGPNGVSPHIALIFGAWQKACHAAKAGGENLAPRHDLFCMDSVLASVVVFLKYCSELLLSIPDALSQISVLLEDTLPLLMPAGRLGSTQLTPPVVARLESSRASILEAFAWLPSGSFPMAADQVFSFSAQLIDASVESEVTCSLLHSLVKREDSLLDSKTPSRAKRDGQVGGAREMEETVVTLTAEVTQHSERESVLYLLPNDHMNRLEDECATFRGSHILGLFACDTTDQKAPTALHEVGTWREPIDPSCSSKVRLVDAAIQAFSATFGLKDGKEQQRAMDMLESLVPPFLSQLARTIGVNTTLIEQDRRSKAKEDVAAVANITAVLLSCLKSLPLHEATHNIPIGLGPPWMNKAKDLLLTLLPSASNVVRRAAAEGLALLATLGVTEDAHFLQSTVLHSLDEVMQGNKPDGKPRALALEPISGARAGSLLTLACIQRTAFNVAQRQLARARGRVKSSARDTIKEKDDDELPVLQMMTRILPSTACYGFRDFFVVRTYAMHSFAILLAYSSRLEKKSLEEEGKQLLRKAVELVENNFSASWIAASIDIDRGQEAEKMATEVGFLAVLLRLMTSMIPLLHHLESENPGVARRFSLMAAVIQEAHGSHPVVSIEAMALFEVLAAHQELLPPLQTHINYSENCIFSIIPSVLMSLASDRPDVFAIGTKQQSLPMSPTNLRAACYTVRVLSTSQVSVTEWTNMRVVSLLVAALERVCGGRFFAGASLLRSLAAPRETELAFKEDIALEGEISRLVPTLLFLEHTYHKDSDDRHLRWILFARLLLSNAPAAPVPQTENEPAYNRAGVVEAACVQAANDAAAVYDTASPVRWQVKSIAAQLASYAVNELLQGSLRAGQDIEKSPNFDFSAASNLCMLQCRDARENGLSLPKSRLVFHLQGVLSAACMSSAATLDQAELQTLQEASMHLLAKLISCFARVTDPEVAGSKILDQYAQQIFSAIKHGLGAPDESDSDAALRLFVQACEALETMVDQELTNDPVVLKRLLRPTVPADDSIPFFEYGDGYPVELMKAEEDKAHINTRSLLLVNIGKLGITGKVLLGNREEMPEHLKVVGNELVTKELHVAVHCAAVAIDGARLLTSSNLSLAGEPQWRKEGTGESLMCGFVYQNVGDIDDAVKAALVKKWSSCTSCSLRPLLAGIKADDFAPGKRDACADWVKALMPVLFDGLAHALTSLRKESQVCPVSWAREIDVAAVAVDCLRGIVLLAKDGNDSILDSFWDEKVEFVLDMLRESVLLPIFDPASKNMPGHNGAETAVLVEESCNLMQELASTGAVRKDSALLVCLLSPLNLIENEKLTFDEGPFAEMIISACLSAAGSVIAQSKSNDSLVKAMLQLVLNTILAADREYPENVEAAAKSLLRQCLNSNAIGMNARQMIALDLAKGGNWDAWSVVFTLDGGLAASKSLETVGHVLGNADTSDTQIALLTTLRSALQDAPIPSPLVGRLLHGVGADILGVLYLYGTLKVPDSAAQSHRLAACADATKLMLIAYQQASSEGSDEEVSAFLAVFFETLLAVLRFNGLPNHPSPQSGADAALGRMSAQAILHTARTTPAPFKTCVAGLSEHERTLLEFAVRAEMSGYAVQSQQAPSKKKLDLKSFKR